MTAAPEPPDLTPYLSTPSGEELELLRLWATGAALTIFDIGSCEGEDSIRYSRRFPNARVFAFEPLPSNQALIRANFARYGASRAELVPVALSDRAGTATFHVSAGEPNEKFAGENWNYGNKSSSLLPPASDQPMHGWIRFPEKITVTCDTLDAYCRQRGISRVDFIHMDVQGAEWLVLQGSRSMLPHIGAICLEYAETEQYSGQKLRPDIEELLRAAGFALVYTENKGVEGDQFYVNTRRWRGRWRVVSARIEPGARNLRRTLAGLRRKAVGKP